MARAYFRHVIATWRGNVLSGARSTVLVQASGLPPAMWSAAAGGVALTNPLVSNQQGEIEAWVDVVSGGGMRLTVQSTDGGGSAVIVPTGQPAPTFDVTEVIDLYAAPEDLGGGGGGPPSGPAGGDLAGTFPNPTVVDDSHVHGPSTVATAVRWIDAGIFGATGVDAADIGSAPDQTANIQAALDAALGVDVPDSGPNAVVALTGQGKVYRVEGTLSIKRRVTLWLDGVELRRVTSTTGPVVRLEKNTAKLMGGRVQSSVGLADGIVQVAPATTGAVQWCRVADVDIAGPGAAVVGSVGLDLRGAATFQNVCRDVVVHDVETGVWCETGANANDFCAVSLFNIGLYPWRMQAGQWRIIGGDTLSSVGVTVFKLEGCFKGYVLGHSAEPGSPSTGYNLDAACSRCVLIVGMNTSAVGTDAGTENIVIDRGQIITSGVVDGQVYRRAAGVVGFGAVDLADPDAVTGLLPDANVAATIARDSEVTAAVAAETTARTSADSALDGRLDTVEATLPNKADLVGGLVATSQLPALAISQPFPVVSQAAMLALAAQRGDLAIRSDVNRTFVLSTDSPGTLADWLQLPIPADAVLSVNGQTGIVVLSAGDVAADPAGTAAAAVSAHEADTTAVHGIADTGLLVVTSDPRLTDQRTPVDGSVTSAKLAEATIVHDGGLWVVTSGVGVTSGLISALDVRQNHSQIHLTTADSVDGCYLLGISGTQGWMSVGVRFDGTNWRATQTGTGLVFGMFLGALNFYTGSSVAVGSIPVLTPRVAFGATGLSLPTVGGGIAIKEGANAKMGVATLVAGTVTVATTAVNANSRIFLTGQNAGGGASTWGDLNVSARTAGTNFTITSANASDTRQVAWLIMDPAP